MLIYFTMGAAQNQASAATETTPSQTATELFKSRVAASGARIALRTKTDGTWRASTWSDWDRVSREIAGGLAASGVEPGDRVVILANTRQEWVECDVGILMAGAITVPIYPSNLPEQCEYIINDCGAKVVIVEDPHQLEKLLHQDVQGKLNSVQSVVYMSDVARLEKPDAQGRTTVVLNEVLGDDATPVARDRIVSLSALRASGVEWSNTNPGRLDDIASGIDAEQAVTIVYTSGTTGPPKGVVLTHANLTFECSGVHELLKIGPEDEQLLFLPLAHIFAKLLQWASIAVGSTIAFAESVPKLISNMQEVKPTFMGAVPRVYEKAYVKIKSGLEEKRKKLVTRLLIDWALKQGKKRSQLLQNGRAADSFGIKLADKLVFGKVQGTFGGRLKFFISGGAPLSGEIAEFFHAAGVLILEGYGLTETTAATNLNRPDAFVFGTVGKAIPGVDIKIAEDGEILMRGGNIMKEYFGKPEATAEVLRDGWFHSGDIGVIEPNGHLRITDRKKDIIVTAGGKNVAPQNLENSLKAACPYISQVMVYGDQRKFLSALITLNEETILPWATDRNLSGQTVADLAGDAAITELIQEYIDNLNRTLASYETIKKFHVLPQDFSQETGELTPTLKVKRKFCTQKYGDILNGFYAGPETSL